MHIPSNINLSFYAQTHKKFCSNVGVTFYCVVTICFNKILCHVVMYKTRKMVLNIQV